MPILGDGHLLNRLSSLSAVPPGQSVIFPNRRINRIRTGGNIAQGRLRKIIIDEKTKFKALNPVGKAVVVATTLLPGRAAFNTIGSTFVGLHVGSAGFLLSNGLTNRFKWFTQPIR